MATEVPLGTRVVEEAPRPDDQGLLVGAGVEEGLPRLVPEQRSASSASARERSSQRRSKVAS